MTVHKLLEKWATRELECPATASTLCAFPCSHLRTRTWTWCLMSPLDGTCVVRHMRGGNPAIGEQVRKLANICNARGVPYQRLVGVPMDRVFIAMLANGTSTIHEAMRTEAVRHMRWNTAARCWVTEGTEPDMTEDYTDKSWLGDHAQYVRLCKAFGETPVFGDDWAGFARWAMATEQLVK